MHSLHLFHVICDAHVLYIKLASSNNSKFRLVWFRNATFHCIIHLCGLHGSSVTQALVKLGREPEVSSCPDCRQLVDEAKNYLLLPEERGRINPEMTQPRKPLQNAVLYAVGGWCTGEALSDVER